MLLLARSSHPGAVLGLAQALCFAQVLCHAGCATAPSSKAGPQTARSFFPLETGSAYTYLVAEKSQLGQQRGPVMVTSVVQRADDHEAQLRSGNDNIRYELRPDGIFKPGSGYYMLKDPIIQGAHWPISGGEGQVAIAAVDHTETVGAGTFPGCIIVVEELRGSQRAEWTYAPGVGPIRMRIFALRGVQPELLLDGELKAFRLGPERDEAVGGSPPRR